MGAPGSQDSRLEHREIAAEAAEGRHSVHDDEDLIGAWHKGRRCINDELACIRHGRIAMDHATLLPVARSLREGNRTPGGVQDADLFLSA